MASLKRPIHSQLNWAILWRHTRRKNWVNCAVLTGNSEGLRTVLSSRLPHTELRSSLRESLSLLADTTMASSQGTSVSNDSFSRWASHNVFLFKYHFLLHILRFLFLFSDNITADVASKQQTTALFLSTIVTRTRRQTELTQKKNWQTWWETCDVPENIQFSFSCSFFDTKFALPGPLMPPAVQISLQRRQIRKWYSCYDRIWLQLSLKKLRHVIRKHTYDFSHVLPTCLCSVSLICRERSFPPPIPISYQHPV
jgi:hypothetical protein